MTDSTLLGRLRRPRTLAVYMGAAALLVALIWVFGGFGEGGSQPAQRTAEVARGDLQLTITATGSVQPFEEVDVGAQVSGQLETVHARVGDHVAKGDLLAEIDRTLLVARLESARASLDGLKAQMAEQQAQAVYAAQLHARNKRLFEGDAISEDSVQSSEASLKVAEARLEALKAQIRQSQSSVEEQETNLNYTKIYAPISGTVVAEVAVEGQTLNANQTTPTILRLANLSTMTVWAEVSEADVMRLKPGMPVYFNTLGSSGRQWHSTLRQILPEPEIVNDVVLFKALVDVDNPDRQLLPDMTAQIFFVEAETTNALLVAAEAVQFQQPGDRPRRTEGADGGGRKLSERRSADGSPMSEDGTARQRPAGRPAIVTVLGENGPEVRRVRTGLVGRDRIEILSGLEEGETVVLNTTRAATGSANRSGSGPRGPMPPPRF